MAGRVASPCTSSSDASKSSAFTNHKSDSTSTTRNPAVTPSSVSSPPKMGNNVKNFRSSVTPSSLPPPSPSDQGYGSLSSSLGVSGLCLEASPNMDDVGENGGDPTTPASLALRKSMLAGFDLDLKSPFDLKSPLLEKDDARNEHDDYLSLTEDATENISMIAGDGHCSPTITNHPCASAAKADVPDKCNDSSSSKNAPHMSKISGSSSPKGQGSSLFDDPNITNVSKLIQGNGNRRKKPYRGAVSRRGGRIASPAKNLYKSSEPECPPSGFTPYRPKTTSVKRERGGTSPRPNPYSFDHSNGNTQASPSSGPMQVSICSSNMDVPCLSSCKSSSSSQSASPRQRPSGRKGVFMNFDSEGKNLSSDFVSNSQSSNNTSEEKKSKIDNPFGSTESSEEDKDETNKTTKNGKPIIALGSSDVYSPEEDERDVLNEDNPPDIDQHNEDQGLTCKERVRSPPPTSMVCFADSKKGGSRSNQSRATSQFDLDLKSPCMFSPYKNLDVMDSPSFSGGNSLRSPLSKSCLRSPMGRSGNKGSNTPTNFATITSSFDTPNASFSWLQSPSQAILSGTDACGTTPVSHFFQEVNGLTDFDEEGTPRVQGKENGLSSAHHFSQICISPLASRKQNNNSGGNPFPLFRSPKSPGNRYSNLDIHMAERNIDEDEDLNVLLNVASSTPSQNVFRPPERPDRFSTKDAQKSSLQLPLINSGADSGSPRLTRKPMHGSKDNVNRFSLPTLNETKQRNDSSLKSADPTKHKKSKKGKHPTPRKNSKAPPHLQNNKGSHQPEHPLPYMHPNPYHPGPTMNGKAGPYSLATGSIPRKQGNQPMPGAPPPHHNLPPPVMARGGSISTVIGGGQNHQGAPRPYSQMNSSGPYQKVGQGGYGQSNGPQHDPTKDANYPGRGHCHNGYNGNGPMHRKGLPHPYPPHSYPKHFSSNVGAVPPHPKSMGKRQMITPVKAKKKPKNSPPKKEKKCGGKQKISSPPVDATAQAAAARQAAAAAGTPNANAAALAAAILRGVTMRPSGKWQAQLYYAGKSRYIGVFDTREKAALAYEIAREKLKSDPKETMNQNAETTDAKVNDARKAAFAGVNEPDPRPKKK
eukprot:CAMPEP_0195509248 /NCGR_PEP_ID=MMETSP0794_2-20130614/2235_1 /TAXON_ID=515487 /ORGANISM="Stephanopyxis turris, Strain CCMP 815" /LENGTH=1095 /DNA_ID=CAMNT_0040636417 /DNA_START=255 /DNA_END=3542 /DNA_ORIENTATION=+